MPGKQWIFIFLAFITFYWPCTQGIAVMSVDLGSEWMKIAIVSPGVPMEIALNKESKRKTPVAIAFRDGERLFGEDAQGIGVRFPRLSYAYLLDLLAKRVDHPSVKLFQERFPYYDIVPDSERGTVLFQHDSETQFSPEQLLAMLLSKAREFASESARQAVNEAVLTVPGFFNQVERKALIQSAELAGIKVLQLINDYTAVALNYGIFRRKDFNETAQYIMFYDMGASSTTVTVASYQLVKTKEKGFVETNPQVAILGVGYDRTLGGLEMQLRLRDHLGKRFNEMKKTSNDVFGSPRALAKLFKEAGRLKNVLSANSEHYAQVENLLDDQDFKLLVTREDFESLCSDLFNRVQAPIHQALRTSGLTMDVINQVILVGAGTRVPKVQEKLAAAVGTELGKNLNTDEAAAMGAVYKAADLSTGFKVKKFVTKDAVIFPIQVVFEREIEGQPSPKQVKRILFGPMNPYPQKKVLTFNKHTEDFEFSINYADLDHLPEQEIQALGALNLSRVSLSGVSSALSKHSGETGTESKGIKAHFTLDDSGLLGLVNVELVLEKTLTEEEIRKQEEAEESPLSKLGSTISNFFTATEESKPESKEEKESQEEETAGGEEKKEEVTSSEEKAEDAKKDETKKDEEDKKKEDKDGKKKEEVVKNATAPEAKKAGEKKPKVVVMKEPIDAAEVKLGVMQLSDAQLQEAAKRLEALNEFDRQRVRRASALNSLEAYIFDAQTKLDTEEYQSAATETDIEKIRTLCSEVADWLYEDGLEANAETYEQKLSELKVITQPLYKRVREHHERPGMLETLHQALNGSSGFLATARNMSAQSGDEPLFTAVEIETLEKIIKETQEWKSKMEEEQAALKLSETPKLTIKAIGEKLAQLDREVKYLVNKAKIWRPPKTKEEKEKEPVNETDSEPSAEDVPELPESASEAEEALPVAKESEDAQGGDEAPVTTPAPATKAPPSKPTKAEAEADAAKDDILPRRKTADARRGTEGKEEDSHTEL